MFATVEGQCLEYFGYITAFDMESVLIFELSLELFSVYLLVFAGGYPNGKLQFQMAKKKSQLERDIKLPFQVFAIIEEVNSALDTDFGLTLIFTIGSFIRKSGLINNSGLYIFFQQYREKN